MSHPTPHYHTALSGVVVASSSRVSRCVSSNGSIFFVHDITDGLPQEYSLCDLLYTEIPWRHGYEVFAKRSGHSGVGYRAFLNAVASIIVTRCVPVIVVGGSGIRSIMPPTGAAMHINLNGSPAVAYCYGVTPPTHHTTTDLLVWLSERFTCCGDFCCGYGRALLPWLRSGKTVVGSDNNANCIGVIKDTLCG